jgi:hypothetical protein
LPIGHEDEQTRGQRVSPGRTPSATSKSDLRILKYFDIKPFGKLDLVMEAFNLFNRTNVARTKFQCSALC